LGVLSWANVDSTAKNDGRLFILLTNVGIQPKTNGCIYLVGPTLAFCRVEIIKI
jgi:hypothetical protein